jgi:hypothetical protein
MKINIPIPLKICKINKFSSFRPEGGVIDETGYGVLHIDNASSDGDVRFLQIM